MVRYRLSRPRRQFRNGRAASSRSLESGWRAAPAALKRGLPGKRLQHEHSLAAIQDAPIRLARGEHAERGFFGWFEQDHPAATSSKDLAFVDLALALPEAAPARSHCANEQSAPPPSLFCSAPLLDALELTETDIVELFGENLREVERENGRLLSFFRASAATWR